MHRRNFEGRKNNRRLEAAERAKGYTYENSKAKRLEGVRKNNPTESEWREANA